MSAVEVISIAIVVVPLAFIFGHMVGYYRGKGRITCPTCKGRGSICVQSDAEVQP